jgi:group I intron endonuclease
LNVEFDFLKQMEGLVELHDNIMYYLVIILFAVGWVLLSIVRNYVATKSPISHKYLDHGRINVPAQKCSNHSKYNQFLNSCLFHVYNYKKVRSYSTFSPNDDLSQDDSSDDQFIPAAIYEDASCMQKAILKDNAGKAGIYMLTNKLTGDIYVGQSIDLRKRFLNYFNLSYLSRRNELIICTPGRPLRGLGAAEPGAIIKYGYSNFSVTILEYCDKCDLYIREQHYFDTLNPKYNIQKIAGGSSKGLILSDKTKNKISKALKGVYPFSLFPKFRLNKLSIRNYSSQSDVDSFPDTPRSRVLAQIMGKNPIFYDDSLNLKKQILQENKGKSGIYMWTNKITGDIYIGQSVDLANRLKRYYNENYLEKNKSFLISRALIKYSHSCFSLTILEYCDKSELNEREQYYLDSLEPDYNILKVAGSLLGYTFTEDAKAKISKALKGINRSDETKDLIREKALARKHSEDTKLKMSMSSPRGNPVNVYEKCDSSGFKLIGSFVSARRAGIFLDLSKSTVIKYMNSGAIYKDRYKFSSR